ncbi:MAG: DUF1631 domain-containing protein [Pseudomonadales bacterium]|nr:DUF1631 domain-containing protein [Pseudomonadales bacterium]
MSNSDHSTHLDVLNRVHYCATTQILGLMDGFYSNIEESLFELAHNTEEDEQRRRCFDLMRELRFRKSGLLKNFSRTLDRYRVAWFSGENSKVAEGRSGVPSNLQQLVDDMAQKTYSHFSGVLTIIAERVADATGSLIGAHGLPIAPISVSKAFVASCRSLRMDNASIEIVQNLFARYVLDCLGPIYGEANRSLNEHGFRSLSEIEKVSGG